MEPFKCTEWYTLNDINLSIKPAKCHILGWLLMKTCMTSKWKIVFLSGKLMWPDVLLLCASVLSFQPKIPLKTKWSGWLQLSSPTSCIFKIRLLPISKRAVMTAIRGLPSDSRAGVQRWRFCQPPAAEWRIIIFSASRWMRPTSLSHCYITHNCLPETFPLCHSIEEIAK